MPTQTGSARKARTPREGTKQATLIAMLPATDGATTEKSWLRRVGSRTR